MANNKLASAFYFALVLLITTFPDASQCDSVSSQVSNFVSTQPEIRYWTKERIQKIRHFHLEHSEESRLRQEKSSSGTVEMSMEQHQKDWENRIKRWSVKNHSLAVSSLLVVSNLYPKHALLLDKQTVDSFQDPELSGESEEKEFPDGYWVRIAQAKVLALLVENGPLPRLDDYSEIMDSIGCHKDDDLECREFSTKVNCTEEMAAHIMAQLTKQRKQPAKENVTLYIKTILKECTIILPKTEKYYFSENSDHPPDNVSHAHPVFHCNHYLGQDNVRTNFRMEYVPKLSPQKTLTSDLLPRYFVIEMSHDGDVWTLTTKPVQPFWLFRFNTKTDHYYQIRVTAVSPKYVYPPVTSAIVPIYKSSELTINRPQKFHVVDIRINDTAAAHPSALLRWKSGSGLNASCDHDVYYMDDDDVQIVERRKGDDAFWVKLDKLDFQRNYSVRVIEKFGGGGGKEADVSSHLYIPSCLEMRQFSFDLCPPPPPSNIRMENATHDSFWIFWNSPKYVNDTNRILHYNLTVDWIQTPHASTTVITSSPIPTLSDEVNYNNHPIYSGITFGNQTFARISNVTGLRGQFKISVSAVGTAGPSTPSSTFVYYQGSPLNDWTTRKILTVIFSPCVVIILIFLLCFLKHLHERRQRQKKRQQTFENYERECLELQQFNERDGSKWEIECCNLNLRDVIGKGNFGLVRRATLSHKGKKMTVAVKTLRDGVDKKEVDKLWEEYEILKNLDPHVHVVGLKGIVTKHVPMPLLVVEYCDGGDLQSHLRKSMQATAGFSGSKRYSHAILVSASASSSTLSNDCSSSQSSIANPNVLPATTTTTTTHSTTINTAYFLRTEMESCSPSSSLAPPPLTVADLLSYSRQIAVGMEYLSSNKIVHRDLAARNILLSSKSKLLKISDFGLSRDVYEQNWYKKNSNGEIPIKWLAIESILNEMYTTKSDVWSYGILLWEIFTYGGNPYPGVDNIKVFGLLKDGYRMPRPDNCPVELYELMRVCWDDEPNERPAFSQIRLILEEIIEKVTHVTYLNLESVTKPGRATGAQGEICTGINYKNGDSGFEENEDIVSPTAIEPVLPPRNRNTFG